MHLLNLTLSRPSAITCAIYGNFSAPKVHEIVVARGKVLELLRPDDAGRVQVVHSTEVFGVIRSLAPFRFPGAQQDYVICGSDSGRIVILQYSKEKNCFNKVHQETYGKSGCRRIVPGEYVAVDPKGRACMVAAVEKSKFVYVLNRDNDARLTISSPLEAHKGSTLCYHVTGLDMGFDNPVFAAIELDYAEADQDPTGEAASEAQKHLTLYELDLGLNHVVRKYSEPIDNGANMLVPVPGAGEGPGGVIVCAENFLIYKNVDHPEVRAVIPRRSNLSAERGVLITAATSFKQKNNIYIFLQSEYGDLYRVSLDYEGEQVKELRVKYFDTIPACTSLCLMRKGFLFAAAEFGDHALYQFSSLGDDDTEAVESSSATLMQTDEGFQPVFFDPRALTNLELLDRLDSLAPITDMKVANLANEEIPQIYAACGRGARSTLRVLRPGLAVTEMAVSPLPGNPTAVWTVKKAVRIRLACPMPEQPWWCSHHHKLH
jgi:splicing factor 3B subunit 3